MAGSRKSTPSGAPAKATNNVESKRAATLGHVKGKGKEVETKGEEKGFKFGQPIVFYDDEVKAELPPPIETVTLPPAVSKIQPPPVKTPTTPTRVVKKRVPKPKPTFSLQRLLLRLGTAYIIYAYFLVCPDQESTASICSGLNFMKSNYQNYVLPTISPIYNTHVRPFVQDKLLPIYEENIAPCNRILEPYIQKVIINSQPVLAKSITIYQRVVLPHLELVRQKVGEALNPHIARWKNGAEKVVKKIVTPSFEWYSREIETWIEQGALPRIHRFHRITLDIIAEGKRITKPIFESGLPFIKVQIIDRIVPFIKSTSSKSYTFTKKTVLPKSIQILQIIKTFLLERFVPGVQASWTTYGSPQMDRILIKIAEYREGAPVEVNETEIVETVEKVLITVPIVEEIEAKEVVEEVEPVVEEVKPVVEEVKPVVEEVKLLVEEVKPIVEESVIEPVLVVEERLEEPVKEVVEDKLEEQIVEPTIIEIVEMEIVDGVESITSETQIVIEDPIDDLDEFIAELTESREEAGAIAAQVIPAYSPPTTEELEAQAQLTKVKRAEIEKLQTQAEEQIANLSISLYNQLVKQLSESRQAVIEGLESRFKPTIEKLDEESDKMVGRLSKYFQRLASPASAQHKTNQDKLIETSFLAKKAIEKVKGKMLQESLKEVKEYRISVDEDEKKLVKEMSAKVNELAAAAQADLGMRWTWLEDVRYSDWQRYHNLAKASKSFISLQNGSIQHENLIQLSNSIDQEFNILETELNALVTTFESLLALILEKGQRDFQEEILKPFLTEPETVEIPVVPVQEAVIASSEAIPEQVIESELVQEAILPEESIEVIEVLATEQEVEKLEESSVDVGTLEQEEEAKSSSIPQHHSDEL